MEVRGGVMLAMLLAGCVGEIPDLEPEPRGCIEDWIGGWKVEDARCNGAPGEPLLGWGLLDVGHAADGCSVDLAREVDGCEASERLTLDLSRAVVEVWTEGTEGECWPPEQGLSLGAGDAFQNEPTRLVLDLTRAPWVVPEEDCKTGLYLILRR